MSYRLPFGKYKYRDLRDVPTEYLEWLTTLDDLTEPLATHVRQELDARSATTGSITVDITMIGELISTGLRSPSPEVSP